MSDNLAQLLNDLYSFYPVGFLGNTNAYPGKMRYDQILSEKIDGVISGRSSPWTKLIEMTKNSGYPLIDMNYLQFPSHIGKMELNTKQTDEFAYSRVLTISISLLTKAYSIFLEETYIFNSPSFSALRPSTILVSSDKNASSADKLIFERIKDAITECFPGYAFAYHKLLMEAKVTGGWLFCDGPEMPLPTHSLYSYLFDGLSKPLNLQVLD